MKKGLLAILFLVMGESMISQAKIEFINSKVLESRSAFSIKLPDDYNKNSNEAHPVILVLNSRYLMEPVMGQTQFQNYFNTMPNPIIVGIDADNIPSESKFYDFINEELLHHLDVNYKTNGFRVVVAHADTGQNLNALLINNANLFRAYLNLSPELTESTRFKVTEKLESLQKDVIYYLATAKNDRPDKRADLLLANAEFQEVTNTHLIYYFDDFRGASEHTLVTRGIAKAFEVIFKNHEMKNNEVKKDNVISYENILEKD